MDSKKLLYEQQMVDEAERAGFCRPPKEKRMDYFGRSSRTIGRVGFRGHEYKKLIDEQHAIQQAEAAGFCIPRGPPKSAPPDHQWDLRVSPNWKVSRPASLGGRRFISKGVRRGSGDAPTTEFSTVTSRISSESRSQSDGEEEDNDVCVQASVESLIARIPNRNRTSTEDTVTPSSSQDTCSCKETVLTDTSANVVENELRCLKMIESSAHVSNFPELLHQEAEGSWTTMKMTACVLLLLILLEIGKMLFHVYGWKSNVLLPRRTHLSLLRMFIDDIIFFAKRRFCDPNQIRDD